MTNQLGADFTKPEVLTNAIMGAIYDVLTNGDATAPASTDNFFSWCTPGIPVSPEDFRYLAQGLTGVVRQQAAQNLNSVTASSSSSSTGTNSSGSSSGGNLTPAQLNSLRAQDVNAVYQQAEMLARMLDFVPDVTKINNNQFSLFSVNNNEGTLSDSYKLILQMSQVMSQDLDQATQDKIAKFRGLLQTTTQKTDLVTGDVTNVVRPSPLVMAYNTKMQAYETAALTYNQARIDALAGDDPKAVENFAINASILRNLVIAAMDDWETAGYKQDYEEIAAYISQVQSRDMKLLKQEYEQELQNATLKGISSNSDFLYTALAPDDFANSGGWTELTFDIGRLNSYANSSFNASGWHTEADGGFMGLFGGGGSSSGNQSSVAFNGGFDTSSFSLRFSICQIPILRPWFKDAFLLSKTWRFDQTNPDFKATLVSDGGSPPKGYLPAWPTAVIFIKDLWMNIRKDSAAGNFIQEQTSSSSGGSGAVSLGPFFLGGSASHYSASGYSQQQHSAQWNDQGMFVPGMQIAGFKCHVLTQKCPNPDPSITNWV